jgi:hypothetical protein
VGWGWIREGEGAWKLVESVECQIIEEERKREMRLIDGVINFITFKDLAEPLVRMEFLFYYLLILPNGHGSQTMCSTASEGLYKQ